MGTWNVHELIRAVLIVATFWAGDSFADDRPPAEPPRDADPPLTRNVPMEEFQNRAEVRPYNFDAPPEGLFRSIAFAEGFEEEMGYRRTHEIVPVNPTDSFRPDSPAIFVVFNVHQHYEPYQVFGVCYPEDVPGLDAKAVIAQDAMLLVLEDESGYVRLDPPAGGWKPGRYKVEIHIGWKVNEISLMGTMRFTVQRAQATSEPAASLR